MTVACFVRKLTPCVAVTVMCALPAPAVRAGTAVPCEPIPVTRHDAGAPVDVRSARAITIASLNVAGQPEIGDAITDWAESRAIDILLLQEVGHDSFDGAVFIAALSERLRFHSVYAPANVMGDNTQGLAIVSRYPLGDVHVLPLAYHHLRFKSRCRIALAATAALADGPVRVVNVHLDTRINSKERVEQLSPVLDALDDHDAPQLIGGDFNTMNVFWFRTMWPLLYLQKQTVAVAERLAASGFHTPFRGTRATFKFLHLPLRLDWLYVKRLKPIDWNVDTIPLTDHRGVWARVGK